MVLILVCYFLIANCNRLDESYVTRYAEAHSIVPGIKDRRALEIRKNTRRQFHTIRFPLFDEREEYLCYRRKVGELKNCLLKRLEPYQYVEPKDTSRYDDRFLIYNLKIEEVDRLIAVIDRNHVSSRCPRSLLKEYIDHIVSNPGASKDTMSTGRKIRIGFGRKDPQNIALFVFIFRVYEQVVSDNSILE